MSVSQASSSPVVIGATGAVGREMLKCLETSAPAGAVVRPFASDRSVGKAVTFRSAPIQLGKLTNQRSMA